MQTIFSIIVITVALLALGAAKVLLRTNPLIGLGIITGCGLLLALCWFLYPKIKGYKE